MSEFKLVKKAIKVVVGEANYEVVKPTVKQVEEFSKCAGTLDDLLNFLNLLGLPKEVARDFQFDSLKELVAMIIPQEEKKS
jgi:hypothetical protein